MQRDIKVINLSLTGPSNLLLERAVKAAIGRGTIPIAAADNDGPNVKPVPLPTRTLSSVTAVDAARKPYRRAVRGRHIDIAAPGVNVWTTASVSGARQKSGTSFAAPFVTAVVSVLASARPDLSPKEIEAELMKSTEDMDQPGQGGHSHRRIKLWLCRPADEDGSVLDEIVQNRRQRQGDQAIVDWKSVTGPWPEINRQSRIPSACQNGN
ncbi:MAG: S8 family serine peptidase [Shinella sp.]|uniref:S8 family serine peptidase n=1 Tax=Shinella sp. TaxID=1870904 RepID=UPI004036D10B